MRIVTAMIVGAVLMAVATPAATAQAQPRPAPLPKTCTDEVTTPGASSCTAWLTGQSAVDVEDAIVKALAGFAVDKGGTFLLSKLGFASVVDPTSGRLDALKAQLDQISQQITVLQTSTDNLFTALKQLSLDTKLQYLRDLVLNIKTLFTDYYVPIVDALGPLVAALVTDPKCTGTVCQKAQGDVEQLKKSFLDQFEGGGGVNLAATNAKIHASLLPSDPGQSVLSAYGDVLMSQNRFLSEAQSSALRQLYTTFANWGALATWMKAEWTAATRPARLPTLIDEEIIGFAKAETAALPPKIPAGAVIDLGATVATRTSTRNRPMWLAAGASLVWRTSGSPAPNDVATTITNLNKDPNGLTGWTAPSRAQMDVLIATGAAPTSLAGILSAVGAGSPTWSQMVNGSSSFWLSETTKTVAPVTCSFNYYRPASHALKQKRFVTSGPYTTHTVYSQPGVPTPIVEPRPRIWPLTVPNLQEIGPPDSAQRAPCVAYVNGFFDRGTGTLLATRTTADSAKEDYMAVYARPKQGTRKAAGSVGASSTSTTTLSSSQNPAPFGEPVTFTAHVQGKDGGDATGQVQFAVDGVVVGDPVPVQGGTATSPPLANLAAGTRRVEAQYLDGSELSFSSGILKPDQVIERVATALTLAADPPNPSYEGDPVVFRVVAAPQGPTAGGGAPSGTVQLLEGDNKIGQGTLEGGQAVITVPSLRDGTHQLVATYAGDDNFEDAKSAPVQQRVVNLRKISVTPAQVAALGQGDTVQLTATGTFSDGTTTDLTADVKWSSSNPGVATVSRTGLVTIASDAPKTTVTIVATLAQQRDTTSIAVGLPGPPAPPAPTSGTAPTSPTQDFTSRARVPIGHDRELTGAFARGPRVRSASRALPVPAPDRERRSPG